MNLKKALFFLVPVLIFSTATVKANPQVAENYNYYTIEPKSSKDLHAALDRATPIKEKGKTFHAYTHWDVHWSLRFWTQGDGTCVVQMVNTTLSIDYTFPQLANAVNDQATLEAFQRYILALRVHEQGHAKNGKDAANAVESGLMGLSTTSCGAAEELANKKGQEILQQYNQLDKDYDDKTQLGVIQGAVL